MDKLKCTGIINDKTMPHNIYIEYKIRIQCIGAKAYTNIKNNIIEVCYKPKENNIVRALELLSRE